MTGLTPKYLAYLREVADGAIPGPWDYMTNRVGDSPLIVTIYTDDPDDPTLIKPLICFESSTENLPDAQFIAVSRTAIPEMLDEIDHLYFLLSESQTDLDNEREFRDADNQIAEMRADVLREEWQIARAERDALAAKVARVEALILDWQANGNSRPLGDPRAEVWHKAARQLRAALAGE